MPLAPLPSFHAVPLRRPLSGRLAFSARGPDTRRVLRLNRAPVAVAEMAFRRLLFFAESPATPWPSNAVEHTAFSVRYSTRAGLDLTSPPLDRHVKHWTEPVAYEKCQALADAAREAGTQVLRYRSARADASTSRC